MMHLPAGERSVAAVLVVVLLASCGSPSNITPPPSPISADASGVLPSGSGAVAPSVSAIPAPGHELYGFVPYWEMDATIADHLATTPLTTVGLFSVTNTPRGAIDAGQNGYKLIAGQVGAAMIAAAHGRGTRVEIVFTSFGGPRNRTFFANAALESATVKSLVALVATLGIDGVNLDVEGLDVNLAPQFGGFVGQLRSAIVAADPGHTVSVATGAGPTGVAMASAAVAAGVDRVFLMGYDYRTPTSSPGASAPVARADEGRSLTWSLDLYAAAGVPPQKLLLGLPLYGVAWPVAGPVIGAPATAPGGVWILRRHLDVLTNPAAVPQTDPLEVVDVYFLGSDGSMAAPSGAVPPDAAPSADASSPAGPAPSSADASPSAGPSPSVGALRPLLPSTVTWTAVYVDSPDTLAIKLGLAEARGLAGGGFWAIGYERGMPAYTDLMTRFVAGNVAAS